MYCCITSRYLRLTFGETKKASVVYWGHGGAFVLLALCGSVHTALTETSTQLWYLAQTTSTNSYGVDLKPAAILFPSIPQYLPSTLPLASSF